ncbi:transmembrane emp24 domain-containing protein p24delta8-like, partial [Salvia hispanica]|uniref:transmembrane emp24 domain-containing protein p24delta8-like n=1 Tax=Salvia hispanica TaxID=49212 RepID=UPI002008FC2A
RVFLFWEQLMEIELKKMLDTVQTIHDEMYYLREREEEMQLLNKSTNSKMFWFSFLSILVCLSVTGIQLWHLKSFFEKKKLI